MGVYILKVVYLMTKNRILSALLIFALLFTVSPIAYAVEPETTQQGTSENTVSSVEIPIILEEEFSKELNSLQVAPASSRTGTIYAKFVRESSDSTTCTLYFTWSGSFAVSSR